MQGDGNLVLYQTPWNVLWTTNTVNTGATFAILQSDLNFVVYDAQVNAKWNSGPSSARDDGAFISLQDDGNLCIYRSVIPSGRAVWCSNTGGHSW